MTMSSTTDSNLSTQKSPSSGLWIGVLLIVLGIAAGKPHTFLNE